MDSGNSGSMQSSSGGDEDYDSRGESISSLLNPASHHYGSIPNAQPPFLSHLQPNYFYPSYSQKLDVFPQPLANSNTPHQYNINNDNDIVWSGALRSQSNFSNFSNLGGGGGLSSSSLSLSSSSSASTSQSLLGTQGQGLNQGPLPTPSTSLPPQSQSVDANIPRASQQADQSNVAKNPKKRTRASRRAPTTILTTDTTNFRQMVQEFTGIPTAPFSGSPYSRRFDIFSAGSGIRSGNLDSFGPLYPLRPSAQKAQLSPFMTASSSSNSALLTSTMIDALVATTNTNSAGSATGSSGIGSTSGSHPLNMQNQILSFQPLLQSPIPKQSLATAPTFNTKSQGNISLTQGDELGMGQFSRQRGSDAATQVRHDSNLARWGAQEQLGLGSNSQHNSGFTRLNCSASTSEFHNHDKGLENVCSGGGEGTVASWTCPSD